MSDGSQHEELLERPLASLRAASRNEPLDREEHYESVIECLEHLTAVPAVE